MLVFSYLYLVVISMTREERALTTRASATVSIGNFI